MNSNVKFQEQIQSMKAQIEAMRAETEASAKHHDDWVAQQNQRQPKSILARIVHSVLVALKLMAP
ncbi:MAG: hypothetical protein HC824_18065 [Synechococcales cyanobacterium RM1_1_8]|nr:hypothetical protein [Synechococcales cyanobacterium RM1_1_8]